MTVKRVAGVRTRRADTNWTRGLPFAERRWRVERAAQAEHRRSALDLASFQRVLFTNGLVRELSDAISSTLHRCRARSELNELKRRARSSSGVPAASVTAVEPVDDTLSAVRFHDILTECRVTPQNHSLPSAVPGGWLSTRTYGRLSADRPSDWSGPAGRPKIRRVVRSGRALTTGWVGGPAPPFDD
jgi:hypothetical protein